MASVTITNKFGDLMEASTHYVDSNSSSFFKKSSKAKYGDNSRAFQYAGSGPVARLEYTLRDVNGYVSYDYTGGHVYYFSMWIMQRTNLTSSISVSFWGGNTANAEVPLLPESAPTVLNEWQFFSYMPTIKPPGTNMAGNVAVYCYNHPGNNGLTNIDGMMWVDLTAAFGAGNEPDKAWCDANIPFTTSSVTVDYTSKVRNAYLGVDGKARAIRQAYIGVEGKARKIKKAYIGVDGKARLLWSM